MNTELATTIMQYFMGGLMALLPAIIWGYFFYRRSPENKRTVLVSFIAGTLSVVPMFIWQRNWNFSFNLFGVKIPNINIYDYVRLTFSVNPTLGNVITFVFIAIAVSLLIYISAAIIIFITDILLGVKPQIAFRNIAKRSIEEPLIFVSIGLLVAFLIVVSSEILTFWLGAEVAQNMVYGIFWYSIMIGFLEEYSKHLVVRFADDNTIYSIDSAITFSIVVALGFAFLENILYFVDRIWLSPCMQTEIANNVCVFDPTKNMYIHQVGVLLFPYIFRSLLSTLAHVVFSGIFGYFYGVAHFASYELQEKEKQRGGMIIWGTLHKIFRMKTSFVFHEMKMLQGLLFAMFFHGIFNFLLDQNLTYLTVPMIALGFLYLTYLLGKKENHKKLRLLVDQRTSSTQEFKKAVENIEMLQKFENDYLKKREEIDKKDKITELQKNVELLEKYEESIKRKNKEN